MGSVFELGVAAFQFKPRKAPTGSSVGFYQQIGPSSPFEIHHNVFAIFFYLSHL